jgi:RNA polymerase sigma-70 factor (ECF subfamily)
MLKFRQDSQLYTWLYRIATNEALSFLKKEKRHKAYLADDAEIVFSSAASNELLISGEDINLKLHKAILMLPAKQRLVFNMKYFDEMKYKDMSAVLGTSVGALKASYHLAVKKIEKQVLIN